ncbi:F-box domain-containing protein [Apiospora aurea]|uniref:F-box domain-containing protein n=1 Tax=Apiospora aurea TaxID=335848 RepID=A0ABR1QL25_9PEZI
MDFEGAPVPLLPASSSHHLDADSSDLASPSSSSGATAQLTPDNDPDSSSDDEKDAETPWADDYHHGQHDVESGSGASYELQNLDNRTRSRPARDHDKEEDDDDEFSPDASATRRRLSDSTAASFQLYTPDEEQAVRDVDIGNARISGMENDLQTRPPRAGWYEWSLTSFYVAYIAFEWMSLLWRIIPAHIYLQVSLIVLSWGVIASLQAVATSYPVLIFLRALLGIGEAAFTGVPFFLSFFFKRSELAYRTALFIAAAPLATTFSSSLAWIIIKLGESGPIAPWRVLFLAEGFPPLVVAVIAWSVVPDSPRRHGTSLRVRERAEGRLKTISSVLLDPKAWLTAVMFFLTNMAYSSLPVFLPMILKEMGHTALESQALSAPPYLIAFVAVLATAHLSDKLGVRAPFIVAHALASAAGYLALALARPLGLGSMLRYLAIYPAAVGFFNVVVLVVAWNINNQPSEGRRGGGFALMQVVGQCGPLLGTRLYPKGDEPYFEPGMWTCAGGMAGVAVVALVLRFYLARLNARMDGAARERGGHEEAQGLLHHAGAVPDDMQPRSSSNRSPQSDIGGRGGSSDAPVPGVSATQLEDRLVGLNVAGLQVADYPKTPGHRISEYENALIPATPRQALGFNVVRRAGSQTDGAQLTDFPNEILTHILSHLHPDSHASVALVSKRFYTLVTTPHAWRMAFQRFFPGQDAMVVPEQTTGPLGQDDPEFIRSEVRHFTRLTAHASWRSEYLLRTRLLRSLVRGKPGSSSGGIGSSSRSSHSTKKASAVLTYNSKLPSMVTNVHATFTSTGKKPPRAIHAAADMCVTSASDPTTGRVEKWGLDDPFAFAQLEEVAPQFLPYGIGEGPAVLPNVMDVSQPYGVVGGEGFPGGRVFFRPSGEFRGRYLGQESTVVDAHADIPKIPELSEAISSLWIARTPAVPSMTSTMVGILVGSTLGIVTSYALGHDPSGPRYSSSEISARWVLSPGVPIIAIKVDESYNQKRKSASRVWAVALNALGEVYYLTQPPTPVVKSKTEDSVKCAWHAGRTTYWQLIEETRRRARPDESGKNAVRGAYSPRSPSNAMDLKKGQMVAEAREIERFLRYKPAHFRKVCDGWDMRRKLEVDFAGTDEHGSGEGIFVLSCGYEDEESPSMTRYVRNSPCRPQTLSAAESPSVTPVTSPAPSIFGGAKPRSPSPSSPASPLLRQVLSTSGSGVSSSASTLKQEDLDEWRESSFSMKGCEHSQITVSSVDMSSFALMASSEDPLQDSSNGIKGSMTPTGQAPTDLPGRGARMIGVGTNSGKVMLWNMREAHASAGVQPVRVIQTESPEISALAMSALYLPFRTLNARSTGRVPRHIINANPALHSSSFSAVGAIYLDPDPVMLRGILAFGTFVRYWAYSSSGQPSGRKRRIRHADVHGRLATRRPGGGVKGFIAAETEELRLEQQIKAREEAWLRSRFGVGLGDLTEEEALRYAEMVSQEAFQLDEQRRTSASDTGSAADFDTTSTTGSLDTVTPDPSITGLSTPAASSSVQVAPAPESESDYELQIQQAIRLSLLEGGDDAGQSPRETSFGDYEAPMLSKEKQSKQFTSSSPNLSHAPLVQRAETSHPATFDANEEDEDLRLALELSLAEEQSRQSASSAMPDDEFPALGSNTGKGKGRALFF